MENQIFPDQRAHGRHDEKRRDQQHPYDAAAHEFAGFEQGADQYAEHHADQQHTANQQQSVGCAGQEARIGEEVGEVLQPHELVFAGIEQVVADQ